MRGRGAEPSSPSAEGEIRSLADKTHKDIADKSKSPKSRLHRNFKILQMNISSQMIFKLFHAGGFETERRSARNGDFSFRRKAQVRTYLHINLIRPYLMQRRHHQGEEETKARAKNGFPRAASAHIPPDGFSVPL